MDPVDIDTPTGAVHDDGVLEPVIIESADAGFREAEADDVVPADAPDAVEVLP